MRYSFLEDNMVRHKCCARAGNNAASQVRGGVQHFFFLRVIPKIYLYRPHGAALEDDWHVPFLVVQSEENALIADLGYCY